MIQGFTNQRCPRCGGNIYIDSSYYYEKPLTGSHEQGSCLQCGYVICDLVEFARGNKVTKVMDRTLHIGKKPPHKGYHRLN